MKVTIHRFSLNIVFLLIVITLTGAFLRFAWIEYPAHSHDESRPDAHARQSFWHFWHTLRFTDSHPPLYYLLCRQMYNTLGPSVLPRRYLSAAAGTASIPLMYVLANESGAGIQGRVSAIAAAALLAVSPMHISHSRTARMYSPAVMIVILVILFWKKSMSATCGKTGVAFVFFGLILVHTHYYGHFLVAALLIDALWHRKKRGIALCFVVWLCSLPWLLISNAVPWSSAFEEALTLWLPPTTVTELWHWLSDVFMWMPGFYLLILPVIFLPLLFWSQGRFYFLVSVFPVLAIFIVSVILQATVGASIFQPAQMVLFLPGLFIMAGYGAGRLPVWAVVAILIPLSLWGIFQVLSSIHTTDTRAISRTVEGNHRSGDIMAVSGEMDCLKRYSVNTEVTHLSVPHDLPGTDVEALYRARHLKNNYERIWLAWRLEEVEDRDGPEPDMMVRHQLQGMMTEVFTLSYCGRMPWNLTLFDKKPHLLNRMPEFQVILRVYPGFLNRWAFRNIDIYPVFTEAGTLKMVSGNVEEPMTRLKDGSYSGYYRAVRNIEDIQLDFRLESGHWPFMKQIRAGVLEYRPGKYIENLIIEDTLLLADHPAIGLVLLRLYRPVFYMILIITLLSFYYTVSHGNQIIKDRRSRGSF